MFKVYYTYSDELEPEAFSTYFNQLPYSCQMRVKRYKQIQDQLNFVSGRMLVRNALKDMGLPDKLAMSLSYSSYQRPYIDGVNLDFNISHSNGLVACAIGENSKVGIDVEWIKEIELADFVSQFTMEEWEQIESNGYVRFYNLWTRKEAVIKADGAGLSLPINEFSVLEDSINVKGKNLFLKELYLKSNYSVHLCAGEEILDVNLILINLNKFN